MHPYEKNIQVLDMNSNDNDSIYIKKNIIDNNHNIDNNIDDRKRFGYNINDNYLKCGS